MKFEKEDLILVNQKTIQTPKMANPLHLCTLHDPATYDNQEFMLREVSPLEDGTPVNLTLVKDGKYYNATISEV